MFSGAVKGFLNFSENSEENARSGVHLSATNIKNIFPLKTCNLHICVCDMLK